MKINSNTNIICLLGHPVKHSFSPYIHNYLFEKYKINNVYTCFDVPVNELRNSIIGVKSLGIKGCNVTIPHKISIIEYLDEIDDNAKIIGAVNTIINKNGILKGYNTDGIGFVKSITDRGYKIENKKIMIIGAGGACRSISVELASKKVKSIEIRNRSDKKPKEIQTIIKENFETEIKYSTSTIKSEDLEDVDILINTTPIGMESEECPIDKNVVPNNNLLVCDIVYKPHNTEFIKWAKQNNLEAVYGIDMLINQGLHAFYIWTNIQPTSIDKNNIKDIYTKSLKNNI